MAIHVFHLMSLYMVGNYELLGGTLWTHEQNCDTFLEVVIEATNIPFTLNNLQLTICRQSFLIKTPCLIR